MQALTFAISFSETYTFGNIHMDPRLLARERARKADNRTIDEIEQYFNVDRPAALPAEALELFRKQHSIERRCGLPQTRPPGFAVFFELLGTNTMPTMLGKLDLYPERQGFTSWEYVHRLVFEVFSFYRHAGSLLPIMRILNRTPFHLQVIPYSSHYNLARNDLLTIFWAATRNLIEDALVGLRDIQRGGFLEHCYNYDKECEARDIFYSTTEFPVHILHETSAARVPPLVYPADLSHPSYMVSETHPFLHKFELDFLNATQGTIDCRSDKYGGVVELIAKLKNMKFTFQLEARRAFLSGVFVTVGNYQLFASTDRDDERREESEIDHADVDLSLYGDGEQ